MAVAWAARWSRRGASERRSMIVWRSRWLAGVILESMQREYASADCSQVAPLTARSIERPGDRVHRTVLDSIFRVEATRSA